MSPNSEDKSNVVIIDYKTGAYSKDHEKQVQDYANILIDMGYSHIDKILIYISEEIKIVKL